MLKRALTLLSILFLSSIAFSEVIRVGLEPFPPLIIDKKSGYTIELLKAIEKISDIKFEIKIMPYNRAKEELKEGRLDLIGHTPYKLEAKEFYVYAEELDFNIGVKADIYVKDKAKLKDIKKLKIGTPRGNETFASDLLGIQVKNFHPGDLENLLRMLSAGRIDAFWFERASTMSTLEKLKIKNIYYEENPKESINASLAVKKDKKGRELKKRLDLLLKKVDKKKILKDLNIYNALPGSGKVK